MEAVGIRAQDISFYDLEETMRDRKNKGKKTKGKKKKNATKSRVVKKIRSEPKKCQFDQNF